ncbi:hypothetical protein FA13DRAFT_1632320 [Coprinellus micaceus]|uniref:C2H2-type domain-containing protein n=1 Tax=Coprinellus micaceus TaxID=71717 RepID=A0A4Y7T567_COPMI|nr:hypothetical protein FA13DRAFT_1632320 [Coprinellus micaceus]
MSFSCLDCNRYFNTSQGLESHCDAKYHDGLWECCNKTFYSWNAWDNHTATAASHRTCDRCNITFSTVDGFEKHWQKKHTYKQPKLVNCNFCDRRFKSPSAYAQHIESGVHSVTRHQVTQAVHTLRVIPQITIAPTLEYYPPSRIEAYEETADDLRFALPTTIDPVLEVAMTLPDAPAAPIEPGPPLNEREEEAALAPAIEPPTVTVPPASRVESTITTYVPGDFVNQGIPYACPICLKTFRNVFALTSHMNSPVHDPDAFMCPKCNKNFRLVSGLIQHLEGGSCKLASPAEIYDRFARLTASFSRLLTA